MTDGILQGLVHLPAGLAGRQVAALDGIRYSAAAAQLAYDRLQQSATQISEHLRLSGGQPGAGEMYPALVLDAWSMVDAMNRCRALIDYLGGKFLSTAGLERLRGIAKDLTDTRNLVQHMDSNISTVLGANVPVWGSVAWWYATPESLLTGQAWSVAVAAGSVRLGMNIDGARVADPTPPGVSQLTLRSVRSKRAKIDRGGPVELLLGRLLEHILDAAKEVGESLQAMGPSQGSGGDVAAFARVSVPH